jgi:hypothetical protein
LPQKKISTKQLGCINKKQIARQGKCEDLSWQYPKVNENKEDGCSIEVEVPRCERAWYENYKTIF